MLPLFNIDSAPWIAPTPWLSSIFILNIMYDEDDGDGHHPDSLVIIFIIIINIMANTSIMEFDPTTAKGTRFLIQASSVFPFEDW